VDFAGIALKMRSFFLQIEKGSFSVSYDLAPSPYVEVTASPGATHGNARFSMFLTCS
jgi:hypothetical protein